MADNTAMRAVGGPGVVMDGSIQQCMLPSQGCGLLLLHLSSSECSVKSVSFRSTRPLRERGSGRGKGGTALLLPPKAEATAPPVEGFRQWPRACVRINPVFRADVKVLGAKGAFADAMKTQEEQVFSRHTSHSSSVGSSSSGPSSAAPPSLDG